MKKIKLILIAGMMCWCIAASAQEIDYNAMEQGGFGDVAKLLQSMTPEQRQEVLKQAAVQQKELEQLSPQELETLRAQLRATGDTIYMDKIDPAKLDPSKTESTHDILKNLQTYQDRYSKGKIHNDVVREHTPTK